jgi:DMSO reductase family type II enzyme chaperone
MNATAQLEITATRTGWDQTDLYRCFAYLLARPTQERFVQLHGREFAASLAELWITLGCGGAFPGLGHFRSFEKYESAYISLFDVGVPEPPVPLVESGHYKSVPAQQTALENASFYEVLGLKADPALTFPDHLLTQLEFLAAVRYAGEQACDPECRANLERLERDFLQRHLLNWLPAAERKLRRLHPPIFPQLLTLLLHFLRQRFQVLSQQTQSDN